MISKRALTFTICTKSIMTIPLTQVRVRLSDHRPRQRLAARKKALPHPGPLRRRWSTPRKRTDDLPELEQQVPETEQALAADRLGVEHRHTSAQGGQDTRRLRRQNPHRRAEQISRLVRRTRALRHH